VKIQGVTNLLAGASDKNVLAGSVFEFIKVPSMVRFYVVGDSGGNIRATIQSGTDVLMEEAPISRQARFPVIPDDITAEDVAMPGDRLKLAIRNVHAATAFDTFWAVDVTPLT